jgi:hypothetical protein
MLGTKVALVSVGANISSERLTAGCSPPRPGSRSNGLTGTSCPGRPEAAGPGHQRGTMCIPTWRSAWPGRPGRAKNGPVGIGLMDYSGSNEDDRGRAGEIRSAYIEKLKSLTRRLVDNGRRVRLLVGDTNNADETVVEEILADLRRTGQISTRHRSSRNRYRPSRTCGGPWNRPARSSPHATTTRCARSCCPSPQSPSATETRARC